MDAVVLAAATAGRAAHHHRHTAVTVTPATIVSSAVAIAGAITGAGVDITIGLLHRFLVGGARWRTLRNNVLGAPSPATGSRRRRRGSHPCQAQRGCPL